MLDGYYDELVGTRSVHVPKKDCAQCSLVLDSRLMPMYIVNCLIWRCYSILASWRRQVAAAKQVLQRCMRGIKFADKLGFSKAIVWSVIVYCSQTSLMQLVSSLYVAMLNLIHQVHYVRCNRGKLSLAGWNF